MEIIFPQNFEGFAPLSSFSIVAVKKSIIICDGFLFYLYFSLWKLLESFHCPKVLFNFIAMHLGIGLFSFIVLGAWCVLSI